MSDPDRLANIPDGTNGATFADLRRRMVRDQLVARGIHSPDLLRAMGTIPREEFVPTSSRDLAYTDQALRIDHKQTISQPFIVAFMTQHLEVKPEHTVLEIGTGSGYQTAVLAALAKHVFSCERIAALSRTAALRLDALGISNVTLAVNDGTMGWPAHAPFDRILVTAGAPSLPAPLLDQLAGTGKMILPIGTRSTQHLVRVDRDGIRTRETSLLACRFVKLLGKAGW